MAIEFHESITLGSLIVGALVSIAIVTSVVYGARWKTAAQVEAANASAWEDAARRLQEQVSRLQEQVNRLQSRVSELESLPDVAAVHAALLRHDEAVAAAMLQHDVHAEDRAKRIIAAIEKTGGVT